MGEGDDEFQLLPGDCKSGDFSVFHLVADLSRQTDLSATPWKGLYAHLL